MKTHERDSHTFISDTIESISAADWRVKKSQVKAYKRDQHSFISDIIEILSAAKCKFETLLAAKCK